MIILQKNVQKKFFTTNIFCEFSAQMTGFFAVFHSFCQTFNYSTQSITNSAGRRKHYLKSLNVSCLE
jgi:hypothetical protein